MALRWDWKAKAGQVTIIDREKKEHTANWWEGNGLMIVLNEWDENGETYWSMGWFFVDEEHAKNCLGLTKDHTNMWTDEGSCISELTINRKYCYKWEKLVKIMIKAFPDIKISLYNAD